LSFFNIGNFTVGETKKKDTEKERERERETQHCSSDKRRWFIKPIPIWYVCYHSRKIIAREGYGGKEKFSTRQNRALVLKALGEVGKT